MKIHKSKWRPIETAPQTGVRVGLHIPYDGPIKHEPDGCTDAGWFDSATRGGAFGKMMARQGITGFWQYDGQDSSFDLQPDAWMPLMTIFCSNAE